MAKTSSTKTTVEESVEVADLTPEAVEKMNEDKEKNTKKSINKEPLDDSDEIKVISLVPNVSYKDNKTLDMYEWHEVGHVEYMTFDTLKNMWRSHKGYFKNLWLKPDDDRVISKFGLAKTFEKYEYLMDASNYTKKNMRNICDSIKETPNGLKIAICDKIKSLIIDGEVSDIHVVKELEKQLQIDLIDFLE